VAWVLTIPRGHESEAGSDAFESFYLAQFPRVMAIAIRTGLDAHEAEDVAQEAFSQFARRYRSDAPFAAAWLRRAAVHLALNVVRAQRRRNWREERSADWDAAGDPHERAPQPMRAVEDAESRAEIRAAIARLSNRHATVLLLRHSGMSYAEVAAASGIPVAHVGSTLRRAEIAFKKEFHHGTRR
jgi:RNA polymerase sigma factor (sigma-70 family)